MKSLSKSGAIASAAPEGARHPTFREAFLFWLKLGFISFGGPTGQIAVMHTELVEKKKWISEARFLHALNYCMLLPGPEAQQLATYVGWLLHKTWGGIVAGAFFIIPSIFILWTLSYLDHGDAVRRLSRGLEPTWTTFTPCFLWIFLGGPYIEKLPGNEALTTTLSAVTAAVVGVVLNLAVWFGLHVIFPSPGTVDWLAILVGLVAFVGMVSWKWDIVSVVLIAGFAGLIFRSS